MSFPFFLTFAQSVCLFQYIIIALSPSKISHWSGSMFMAERFSLHNTLLNTWCLLKSNLQIYKHKKIFFFLSDEVKIENCEIYVIVWLKDVCAWSNFLELSYFTLWSKKLRFSKFRFNMLPCTCMIFIQQEPCLSHLQITGSRKR